MTLQDVNDVHDFFEQNPTITQVHLQTLTLVAAGTDTTAALRLVLNRLACCLGEFMARSVRDIRVIERAGRSRGTKVEWVQVKIDGNFSAKLLPCNLSGIFEHPPTGLSKRLAAAFRQETALAAGAPAAV